VPPAPRELDPEQLDTSTKESINKLHSLVDDLKEVEAYEKKIVECLLIEQFREDSVGRYGTHSEQAHALSRLLSSCSSKLRARLC
jgi:hypothetical protein